MAGLVYLIERLSIGLYVFCGLIFFISMLRFFTARGDLSASSFELERELAYRKGSGALTGMIIAIEIALAIFAVVWVVAPTIREDALTAASAGSAQGSDPDQPFQTATPGGSGEQVENIMLTVTAQVASGETGPRLILTEANPATPVGTIIAGYPTPTDCNTENASLAIPANGQVVFDVLTVEGTAAISGFAFYKFELSGPSTGYSFTPILGMMLSPVAQRGVLGQIPLAGFATGDYTFRLVVFDTNATLRASCTVNILIQSRPPTITPFPTAAITPIAAP